MIKPQLIKITYKKDLKKVPSKFSTFVGQRHVGHVLIIIDGDEKRVATSAEIEKILKKLKIVETEKYAVVITNLTIEAEELLRTKGIDILRTNYFLWTDEDYKKIKSM